jgi:hypothetical protein
MSAWVSIKSIADGYICFETDLRDTANDPEMKGSEDGVPSS